MNDIKYPNKVCKMEYEVIYRGTIPQQSKKKYATLSKRFYIAVVMFIFFFFCSFFSCFENAHRESNVSGKSKKIHNKYRPSLHSIIIGLNLIPS